MTLVLCGWDDGFTGRLTWDNELYLLQATLESGLLTGELSDSRTTWPVKVTVRGDAATLTSELGTATLHRRSRADSWASRFEAEAGVIELQTVDRHRLSGTMDLYGVSLAVDAWTTGALCWGRTTADGETQRFIMVASRPHWVDFYSGNLQLSLKDVRAFAAYQEDSNKIRLQQQEIWEAEKRQELAAQQQLAAAEKEQQEQALVAQREARLSEEEARREAIASLAEQLVKVPAGSFRMGEERQGDAFPPRQVTISRDFWMGTHEVTQGQYEAVMGELPSRFPRQVGLPVENLTWLQAKAFCDRLNTLLADHRPEGYVFRLPSEAEWEYAARGGPENDPYLYAGSDNLDRVAWYETNNNLVLHPVGTKKPNALGLYDLSGNVSEWCLDWYDETWYQQGSRLDPVGPARGEARVLRGGSWGSTAEQCEVVARFCLPADYRSFNIGFRIVLGPDLAK